MEQIDLYLFQYSFQCKICEMQQQPSQTGNDEFGNDQMSFSQVQQDLQQQQNQPQLQSPSTLNLRRPSVRSVRIKSMSSCSSRTQIIKVTKTQAVKPTPSPETPQKRQCRICLQDQSEGRLIKPCKCTGSMQFIHEHCLCEWIKRKLVINRIKAKINCEVCQEPFSYKLSKRLSLSCETLKNNADRYRSNYVCFAIVMAVLFAIWLAMTCMLAVGISDEQSWVRRYVMNAEQTRVIFICVVFVYLLIMVFVTLLFVAEYGIKSDLVVKSIQNYTKKCKRIMPVLYAIAN